MEKLCRKRRTDAPLADLNNTGKGTLKNFTIPRKRRATGTSSSFLEPCSTESREYSFILSTLNDSRLEPNKHIFLSSGHQQVRLVHNEELLREYSEKRSEMRSKGRNVREMEEKFCFLVESAETTDRLCEQGLKVDRKSQYTVGNPMHGVCLYKHADVALRNTTKRNIIIFKVILGKVKRVPTNFGKNGIMDPIIHYDCYISKDPSGPKSSLSQQAIGSSVYFFDYDENQELNTRPRQCLPYAVVTVDSVANAFSAVSSSSLVLPTKIPSVQMSTDSSKPFKTCTLAERRGKGQNATVTFRQLGGPENFMHNFECKSPWLETVSLFQRVEQMNTHQTTLPATLQSGDLYLQQTFGYCTLQEQWAPTNHNSTGHHAAPASGATSGIATPHNVQDAQRSSTEVHSSTYMSQNKKFPSSDLCTAAVLSNFSIPVSSSYVMRDPRLFRQESSNLSRTALLDTHQDMPTGQKSSECDFMKKSQSNFFSEYCYQNKEISETACEYSPSVISRQMPSLSLHSDFSEQHEKEESSSVSWSEKKLQKCTTNSKTKGKEEMEQSWSPAKVFFDEKLMMDRISLFNTYVQNCDKDLSSTNNELRPNSSLQISCNNFYQTGSLETPVCLKVGLQNVMQTASLGTDLMGQRNHFSKNNSCEQSAFLPGLCNPKHPMNTLENVEQNSTDDREKHDSLRDIKEADADVKGNKEKEEEESAHNVVAVEIRQNNAVPITGSLTHIENLLSDECQKHFVDKQDSGLQFIHHRSHGGKDDLQLKHIHEQSSDLKKKQEIKTGKASLLIGLTSEPSPKLSENSECMKVYEKNSSLVSEENQLPMDCADLDQSENYNSVKNCPNSELNHISEPIRSEDSLWTLCCSSAMEKREMQSEEFLDVGCFEEIRHLDDPQEVHIRKSDIVPHIAPIQEEEINVQNPSNGCPRLEGKGVITNNEVTSTQHAKGENEEIWMSDALLCVLYERMQFSELFPMSGQEEQLSDKPYLKPRNLEIHHNKDICLSPAESIKHANNKYNLRVTLKTDSLSVNFLEPCILSERIPFTQSPKKKKQTTVVLDDKLTNITSVSEVVNNGKDSQNGQTVENWQQVLRDGINVITDAHSAEEKNARLVKKLAEKYNKSELSLIKKNKKAKSKTAVQPISSILQSDTSNSLEIQVKDSSYPCQLSHRHSLFSSCKSANKVNINCEPLLTDFESTEGKMVQQSVPVSPKTLCFMKEEESNSEYGLGSNSIDDSLYVAQSVVQDTSMVNCTTIKLCECKVSRTCKLKKVETLKKTRGPRKQTGKATLCQRKKPTGKWLLCNPNNAHLMSGWKNKKILAKRFMLLRHLQRGPLKSFGGTRKTKINNVKRGSVKRKGNTNSGNKLAAFTTAEKNEAVSEDKRSEMRSSPANLSEQAANTPYECTPSDTDTDSKVQNDDAQLLDIHNARKDDKLHSPESLKKSDKIKHHMMNKNHRDEHTSQCYSAAVFTCEDSPAIVEENGENRMLHVLEKQFEESWIEMPLLNASEQPISNDGPALYIETLLPNEPQARLETHPVKTATITEVNNSHMQEHKNFSKASSKIRLITKLRYYLQKKDSSKKLLQSRNLEVLSDSINPLTLEKDTQKVIPVLAAQQPECEICAETELPYCNPEDSFTSDERKEVGFLGSSDLAPAEFIIGPSKSEGTFFSMKTSVIVNNTNILTENTQNELSSPVLEEGQNQNKIPAIGPCDAVMSVSAGSDNEHSRLELNEKNQEDVHFEHNIPVENHAHNSYTDETVQESEFTTTQQHRNDSTSNTTSFQKKHSATDISDTLRKADNTPCLEELLDLKSKCKEMLQFFISTFEKNQNIGFNEIIVSKDLILDQYLYHPPKPVDLKYEALHSFFELQMMMEAMQFVENKIRYLSGEPTFRSLLWYDHSLYSELYIGGVKHRLQSSIYPSLQENIFSEGSSRLQKCKSVLTHQHERSTDTDTSYYVYLKKKREKLEVQAILKNNLDSENFNPTIPLSCGVNPGDTLKSLEVLQKHVSTFTDAYFSHLQGNFDAGIAEHLSIFCLFVDEKMKHLKTCKTPESQVAWFGLEHLCYNASKIIVWKSSKETLAFNLAAVSMDPNPKVTGEVAEAATLSSKIKMQQDTVSIRRTKSQRFMTGNKKKRQIKQCGKVPLMQDFSQDKGWLGNTPLGQNGGNEVANLPPKYTKNHENLLLPTSSRAPSVRQGIGQLLRQMPTSNGSTQCQTGNWATSEAELVEMNSASVQLHNRMTTFLPATPFPSGNLNSSEKPCGTYNIEWPPSSPLLHPEFIKSGALQPCYDIWPHMHTYAHDVSMASPQYMWPSLAGREREYLNQDEQWLPGWNETETRLYDQTTLHPWTVWGNCDETQVPPCDRSTVSQGQWNSWDLYASSYPPQLSLPYASLDSSSLLPTTFPQLPISRPTSSGHIIHKPRATKYPFFHWSGGPVTSDQTVLPTATSYENRYTHNLSS